jgi:hypothetical protein
MSGRLAVAAVLLANVAELANSDRGPASKGSTPACLPIFLLHPSSPSLRPPAAVAALRGGGSRLGTHAAASDSAPVSAAARSLPQPPEVGSNCESNLTASGDLANARTGRNRLWQTIRALREQDASKRIPVRSLAFVSCASTFVASS